MPDLLIPPETQAAYPAIIELIVSSQSMNDEERQYWVNILPSMKAPQRDSLTGILTRERDQLAAIEKRYRGEQKKEKPAPAAERRPNDMLIQAEAASEEAEEGQAEDLLNQISQS